VHRKPAVVDRTNDARRKNHSYSSGTDPDRQAIWEMPSGQIDDHNADEDKSRTQLCVNFVKKPATSWTKAASLFR
jgi:hypothetical protein